jgi:GNAT superfamily N-acetyltransferase
MIEIRTGDRQAAFDVPFQIYEPHWPYVSPMWTDVDRIWDSARNPLALDGHGRIEVFTAHRAGKPVGRIVATLHDASNRRHGTTRGQFGFFDCADDLTVAHALLAAAETWLHARGATEAIGNFNLTAMQMAGVMTGGFEAAPYTDMMWSPPHIAQHLARCGYAATFPMTTFQTNLDDVDPAVLSGEREQAVLTDPAFTWAPINRWSFKRRLADAQVVLNAAFDKNPMFVPLTGAEFLFQAGEMMWILDPRLSVVVYHEGRPAGVIVCIPDLNPVLKACGSRLSWSLPWHLLRHRLTRERAVIVYYAVIPELHGKRLNGAMLSRLVTAAKSAGYRSLGGTWIADVNTASLRQVERYGAKPLHRLHLFRKALGTS